MDRKIIVTKDNSKTLLIPALNETYHSTNGAFNEALHVFIEAGLAFLPQKASYNVFEMGFGTGLNALVSIDYSIKHNQQINYTGVEKYPLSYDEAQTLEYTSIENFEYNKQFELIHNSPWETTSEIIPLFELKKIKGDLAMLNLPAQNFDIIFFDAFGPKVQPDLWTAEIMQKMHDTLLPGGVLVTYCAQGQFKRNLKAVGFEIEMLPGPNGKREMTRAIKTRRIAI